MATSTSWNLKLNFSRLLTVVFAGLLFFPFYNKVLAQSPGGVGTANLKMWLKADAGTNTTTNGTGLTTWTDQSPDGRNATQATAGSRPTFYNTTNLINFNPAINFDGTEDMSFSSTGLPSGSSTRFLFAVATANGTAGSNQWIFSYGTQTANRNFSIGQEGGTNNPFNGMWGVPADVIQTGSAFSSVPLIISGGFSGTTLSVTSNQRASATKTNNSINTQLASPAYIGRSAGGSVTERWNGLIAEVICFNSTPTANQSAQIHTYLALKYGISLDATAAINYRSSNLTTIWNYASNTGYNNDIAGIGLDDNSGLNQKQSKSVNTDDLVTIGLGTIAATNADNTNAFGGSNRFFIWGNNDGATNAWTTTEAPTCFKRIAREWKVQETGSIGSCKYRIPESGAATNLPGTLVGPMYMLVDGDGDFSTGATPYLMTKVGNNWEVDADLSSGQYFTFANSLATSVISGNATVCYGASTNLSIALKGTSPWSLTYSDGLTPVSVTGITTSPYVVSVSPLAASTYTVTALSAGGCTSTQAGDRTGSAAITVNASLFQLSTEEIVAYYKFNGNANDETKKNQGILQNAPTATADRFGNANSAYLLNGTNQYITTTNSFTDPNVFSFSIWFNTTTLTGGKLVSFGSAATGGSTDFDRHIYMSNTGKLNLGINPTTSIVVSSPLAYNDGNWHLATATVGAAGMNLYVDGSLVATDAGTTGGQFYTGRWRIGYDNIGTTWSNSPSSAYFSGAVDDVMIFHRELSAAEVAILYNSVDGAGSNSPVCVGGTLNLEVTNAAGAGETYSWTGPNSFTSASRVPSVTNMNVTKAGTYRVTVTQAGCTTTAYALGKLNSNLGPALFQPPASGLLSYYKLDGNANDETGLNPGVFQNAPTTTTDRFGIANKAYAFNGTSQYMTSGATYTNLNDFTFSLWFRTSTATGGRLIGIGSASTGASGQYDRHIYMANSGQLYFGLYPGGVQTINTTASYNDNLWHQVTATLSSTSGINLYVDGELVASNAAVLSGEPYTGYVRVGYDNNNGWTDQPGSFFFAGSIDDVIMYNRAITASEATTLFNTTGGAGINAPICVGSTLNLSAFTVGGATYSWTGPNSFNSVTQNPSFTYTAAAAGTYTLTVTQGGCTSTGYALATNKGPGQWSGAYSTDWHTANNWCNGSLPTTTTDVIVPGSVSNMPVVTSTANARNLTVNSTATLTKNATGTLNIYGNFTNNGTFTDNGIYTSAGSVVFMGSTAQNMTGTTTFNNLTLNNTNGLTLNSTTTVNGILRLTLGNLTTGNNLNQNLYTGAIAGTGTGTTSGNVRFFKTIWGDRYHYLSAPIAGLTAADWNDDVTLKFGANSNIYSYDETLPDTNRKAGWTPVASAAVSLQSVKGYAVFFPSWIYNTLLDVNGTYTHNASFNSGTLSNTPSTAPTFKAASDGWHLVGNPYPSTIDWNAASGWTKTGLNNAIYTWDGRTNRYVSYVAGVGTNGGTQYIGSMQGFFVKVTTSGGSGSLAMNNNVRVTSTLYDVWRTGTEDKIFRLKIAHGEYNDETVIRFSTSATEQFDDNLDAYKLLNEANVPSLFSLSSDADYSVNSLPYNLSTKTIPLQVNVMTSGEHSWTADLSGFQGGESVFLEDRLLGTSQNLAENPTYTVHLDKGELKGRFFINYARHSDHNNPFKNSNIEISAIQQNIFLLFSEENAGKADIAIFDALGKKVYTEENVSTASGRIDINLPNANSGIYIVKVQTASGSKTQQVSIQK